MVVKKALFINHSCDLKSEYPNNINNKVAHISSIKSNPIVPYRSKPNMSVKTNSEKTVYWWNLESYSVNCFLCNGMYLTLLYPKIISLFIFRKLNAGEFVFVDIRGGLYIFSNWLIFTFSLNEELGETSLCEYGIIWIFGYSALSVGL